uniref:zinc finger and SCAN domain-containing protein 2-like n=1 Tax=Doryrhamphus excisus TaxID=161450 RepID=UPI0025ADFB2C|nr:zinc finger and SCAN domain-containing protein 2-like [Doryrhamphus excisus]
MCKVQMLRSWVSERLTAAVEEIFVVLERTIAEYEGELSRTKAENERQRQRLEAVFRKPQIESHGSDTGEEDLPLKQPERQEGPQPPNIKKEDEEQGWTRQGADISNVPATRATVQSEGDEDEAQRSQLGGSQSGEKRRSESLTAPLSDSDDTDDGDSKDDVTCRTDNKHLTWEICGKRLALKGTLIAHKRIHAGQNAFWCSVCSTSFCDRFMLERHTRTHTGEKPFACSLCGNSFSQKCNLMRHTRTHTGERTFSCSVCDTKSTDGTASAHTCQKPFACSVCGKRFSQKANLVTHMRTHTGEKPFPCSVCGERFSLKDSLMKHTRRH